jgi:hypothetical protein
VERTGCVEAATNTLAHKFPNVKFVTIAYTSAINNWPSENLPTIFLYRNGRLQEEFIRLNPKITADEIEWILAEYGILRTELGEPPKCDENTQHSQTPRYGGPSPLGGSLAKLEIRRHPSDDDDSESTK